MSLVLFLLTFGFGVFVGVKAVLVLGELSASTEAARRRAAVRNAEVRVQRAQTAALNRLADVASRSAGASAARWPSEGAGEILKRQARP